MTGGQWSKWPIVITFPRPRIPGHQPRPTYTYGQSHTYIYVCAPTGTTDPPAQAAPCPPTTVPLPTAHCPLTTQPLTSGYCPLERVPAAPKTFHLARFFREREKTAPTSGTGSGPAWPHDALPVAVGSSLPAFPGHPGGLATRFPDPPLHRQPQAPPVIFRARAAPNTAAYPPSTGHPPSGPPETSRENMKQMPPKAGKAARTNYNAAREPSRRPLPLGWSRSNHPPESGAVRYPRKLALPVSRR